MPWLPVVAAISAVLILTEVLTDDDQEVLSEDDQDDGQEEMHAEEQKRSRAEISELKRRISAREQEHDALLPVLGRKNRQIRRLAEEICALRGELEEVRRHVR